MRVATQPHDQVDVTRAQVGDGMSRRRRRRWEKSLRLRLASSGAMWIDCVSINVMWLSKTELCDIPKARFLQRARNKPLLIPTHRWSTGIDLLDAQ